MHQQEKDIKIFNYFKVITPNYFVIHNTNRKNREVILKYGLIPKIGKNYYCNWIVDFIILFFKPINL